MMTLELSKPFRELTFAVSQLIRKNRKGKQRIASEH